MLTMHAIAGRTPVLVGCLRPHRRGAIPGRPCLAIEAWCPACRDVHRFALPDLFPLDAVEMVAAPCPTAPWAGTTIAVGLDPGRMAEHRRTLADFVASLRRWKIQARMARQFAESRSADRRHLAEGWDVDVG